MDHSRNRPLLPELCVDRDGQLRFRHELVPEHLTLYIVVDPHVAGVDERTEGRFVDELRDELGLRLPPRIRWRVLVADHDDAGAPGLFLAESTAALRDCVSLWDVTSVTLCTRIHNAVIAAMGRIRGGAW